MTAISAATAQPMQPGPHRPAYFDEIDPADEHHEGAAAVEGDLSFDDLIDLLNPLQHLPIVSTVYRAITGDQIQPHVRAIGSGLYGGPIGFLAAGAAMAIEEAVGTSPDKILADLFDGGPDAPDQTVASAPNTGFSTDVSQTAAVVAATPSPPAAIPTAPDQSTANAKGDASGAQAMFTIKERPKFFALPDTADRSMPLPPRPNAVPTAQAATTEAALAAQAATAGMRPLAPSEAPQTTQGLSAAQGDLLDRFVTGTKAAPSDGQSKPAPASMTASSMSAPGPTPEWIATQMQANLQKYADAQRDRNAGS